MQKYRVTLYFQGGAFGTLYLLFLACFSLIYILPAK
jgi:hypothetical protein